MFAIAITFWSRKEHEKPRKRAHKPRKGTSTKPSATGTGGTPL
jgi:hypothetical protein